MTAHNSARGASPVAAPRPRADRLIAAALFFPALTWPAETDDWCVATADQGPVGTVHRIEAADGSVLEGVTDAWPDHDEQGRLLPPPAGARAGVDREPVAVRAAVLAALATEPDTKTGLVNLRTETRALGWRLVSDAVASLEAEGAIARKRRKHNGRLMTFYSPADGERGW